MKFSSLVALIFLRSPILFLTSYVFSSQNYEYFNERTEALNVFIEKSKHTAANNHITSL